MTPMTLLQRSIDGVTVLCAPAVGRVFFREPPGAVLTEQSAPASLEVLGRRHRLMLPPGVEGRLVRWEVRSQGEGVGYGAPLLVLAPLAMEGAEALSASGEGAAAGALHDVPEGGELLVAPTEGQFYRRPSPDASPFVEEGSVVHPGQQVGLIEVMKFFHPLHFEGQNARPLVRWLVEDAVAVEAGQAIAVLGLKAS